MKKIIRFAPLALAAALSLGSVAVMAKSPAQWQAIVSQSKVSLDQAMEKAAQAVAGKVIDIELETGDGTAPRYEADVVTPAGQRVVVWVNATTGDAAEHQQKGKAKSKDLKHMSDAKITIAQAVEAALKSTSGTAIAAELDSNWGKASYDVKVLQADGTVMKVKIDAVDSSVIRTKKDK